MARTVTVSTRLPSGTTCNKVQVYGSAGTQLGSDFTTNISNLNNDVCEIRLTLPAGAEGGSVRFLATSTVLSSEPVPLAGLEATAADLDNTSGFGYLLINRIGAFTGSGANTILGFLRAIMSKASSLTPTDVGGSFDNTADSLEAQNDKGVLIDSNDRAMLRQAIAIIAATGGETGTPRVYEFTDSQGATVTVTVSSDGKSRVTS